MAKEGLEPGNLYILHDKKGDLVFGLFGRLAAKYKDVRCVARTHPDRLQKDFGIPPESILWLSNTGAPGSVNPQSIGVLTDTLLRIYEKAPESVVVLEGMEYLMTQNDFAKVLRLVNYLYEAVAVNRGILIIALDPAAFSEKEMAYLSREAVTIGKDDELAI